jgi:adenine-specific DNA-methyltransferase
MDALYTIKNQDVLEAFQTINDDSIDLIVTSPPYNIGKSYEQRKSLNEYLDWQRKVIIQCIRVLKDGGSIYWQVGAFVDHGEIFPLDYFFYQIFKEYGLTLRNRIVWHFNHGLHAKKKLSGRYETILWVTKGSQYKFNLDPIRIPSKYPGKKHFTGEKKGLLSGNPLGKNPSDFWEFMLDEFDCGVFLM